MKHKYIKNTWNHQMPGCIIVMQNTSEGSGWGKALFYRVCFKILLGKVLIKAHRLQSKYSHFPLNDWHPYTTLYICVQGTQCSWNSATWKGVCFLSFATFWVLGDDTMFWKPIIKNSLVQAFLWYPPNGPMSHADCMWKKYQASPCSLAGFANSNVPATLARHICGQITNCPYSSNWHNVD